MVFESLRRGENVVTANKALVAMCLPEIEALVKEVNEKRAKEGEGSNGGAGARRSLEFRYEAAVCEGGYPSSPPCRATSRGTTSR